MLTAQLSANRGMGRRAPAALLGAILLVFGLNACQTTSLPAGSEKVRASEGRVDATVTMTGTLHVELLGNAGTPFAWRLAAVDPGQFELLGPPHVTPLDPGVMGGRTLTTFQFRPLHPGQSTIVFELASFVNKDEPPARTVQVEAKVTGGGA